MTTTKENKIRGLLGNPLILHPLKILKLMSKLNGKEVMEIKRKIPLLTIVGYSLEGKVYVGVSVCSRADAYSKKIGVLIANGRLQKNPMFIGTVAVSEDAKVNAVSLSKYLKNYREELGSKIAKENRIISIAHIIGYSVEQKFNAPIKRPVSETTPA